jgi:hypothetical protein
VYVNTCSSDTCTDACSGAARTEVITEGDIEKLQAGGGACFKWLVGYTWYSAKSTTKVDLTSLSCAATTTTEGSGNINGAQMTTPLTLVSLSVFAIFY